MNKETIRSGRPLSIALQYVRIAPFREDFTTDGTDDTDESRLRPKLFPIREIREGMMFVSGASWVTQEAVAGRTETRSP